MKIVLRSKFPLTKFLDYKCFNMRSDLADEVVADLAHEHHEARGRVVELRVLPDQQDRVHQRLEHLVEGVAFRV